MLDNDRITIITRADDCGSSHSANIGILQALEGGILKNISLMAPCDFIEEAASMLASRNEICFGLHTTLNAEWDHVKWGPVLQAQVPSLVDENGMFLPTPKEFLQQKPDLDEIMLEIQAQLDKLKALGFRISYVDTHMAPEYEVPGLEERLSDWTKKEGLLYWNNYCSSIMNVMETEDLIENMVNRLKATTQGQYLYVAHPAVDSPEMRRTGNPYNSGDLIAKRRDIEMKLFTDSRILQTFRERNIIPIGYDKAVKTTEKLPPLHDLLQM
jgi:chitin disaccharide deacetylase